MRGIHHQHGVKLESDTRTRLDIPHAGKHQRGHERPIGQPRAQARGHFLQQLVARRVLHQSDQ